MCYTYDKSKGGNTRELQSRTVPPKKKLGRVTLSWGKTKQNVIAEEGQSTNNVYRNIHHARAKMRKPNI